jgi:hypothetical protein
MAIKYMVQAIPVLEYNGTNASAIMDALAPGSVTEFHVELVSETGGEATFRWTGWEGETTTFTAVAGDWIRVGGLNGMWGVFSSTGQRGSWVEIPGAAEEV